jgi:hypothetical protein
MTPSPVASRPCLATTGSVCPPASRRRERGAVLVHVAVAMMGLLAFSALTIDLGSLWVARAQAQNAADAGALAGGVSLAYVDPTDLSSATAAATTIVQQHQVWGRTVEPASIQTVAGTCPAGAPASPGTCLQVRVSRDNASGTPLPVFFSRLFGVNAAEVHSTASAKVMLGNAMPCPRPIAIPDRWIENLPSSNPWTSDDVYNKYIDTGYATPPPNADVYTPPDPNGPGSGITVASMTGVRVVREQHRVWMLDPLHAGDFLALDLPRPGGATDMEERYVENFTSCSGSPVSIGEQYPVVFPHTRFTREAISAVMAQDPGAAWDGTTIRGSAFTVSPRLITIAIIDPDDYASQVRPSSTVHATVRNLVGFFVDDHSEDAYLEGVILPAAGLFDPAAPSVTDQSTFLRTVALVR